ncbi:class I SAM-dependent methyltransferase [Paenibacillus pedocola]|uniref:class I SAM-dependent methyltransferase n=1 Tax=Paenibacillus pedocola TaxID=3242193 RepID=UPI0028777852|nr:class I SAM-dependent methyltransferase [Paenibacillus typhae]
MNNNQCPICQSSNTISILTREQMPVFQNILINNSEDARQLAKGDLTILQCGSCGFVYNSSFDSSKVVYGSDYENTQSHSQYFDKYLDELVATLVNRNEVRNVNVVEIGCGKGVFLRKIVEGGENRGYGFDPSYIGSEIELEGKLKFEKRLFNEECVDIKTDVVICRHVIEHISEPLLLLRDVRSALTHSPHAKVFFETPCVEWIFKNKVMFDIFYEHCSYFSKSSLTKAFELAGFEVVNIEHIFNDQYLWLEARIAETEERPYNEPQPTNHSHITSIGFAKYELDWKKNVTDKLSRYCKKGKIAIWGAGAKGVTFLNLIDPDRYYINCVIDVNPNKVGNFVPGTGHEIIGVSDLGNEGISTIIVMNPNYFGENKLILEKLHLDIELINIEHWNV